MSIASEITRITGNVSDSYTAANAKGATMPATQDSDHLAATIATIPSGITPTGTKNITTNGTHDVAAYEYADVQVPTTAPAHYVEKSVDANGKLVNSNTVINLTGVTDVGDFALQNAYRNSSVSGSIDLSPLTTVSGSSACGAMFYGCTGTISVDLSSLTTVSGSSACSTMFYGCTGLTSADLSALTTVSGQNGCQNMFNGCTNLTTANLSALTTISQSNGCQNMFQGCTSLTTIDLSSLHSIVGNSSCSYMFGGCTGLTGTIDLSSLTTTSNQEVCSYMFSGCTGLTSVDLSSINNPAYRAFYYMFYNCTGITSVNFSSLTTLSNYQSCSAMFYGCIGITSVDLSSLVSVTGQGACSAMFYDCKGITSVNLSSLTTVSTGGNGFTNAFRGCTSLTTVDLSSLTTIGGNLCFSGTFYGCANLTSIDLSSFVGILSNSNGCMTTTFGSCTSLTTLSFPCFSYIYTSGAMDTMLTGCSGVTVHFPANKQSTISALSGYPNFGGTNTTVLFDLPSTNTLTGADTNTYSRNPKYDTATALAWKVGAYGTTNFTPAYYTSGTTDPVVGDTIYSDAACTTAVTTISAIA